LIEDVYPSGIVSIVSDTWDLWKVLTEYVPNLKDKILARDGKLVIRPDSGDPVNIICGDPDKGPGSPAGYGTLRLLASALGVTDRQRMLPLINKAGAIYGDSINLERAEQILSRTVFELKLSPYNVVFGIGSYTYEYVTRDTYGFAMKATAVRRNGEIVNIYKKPITDSGEKASLTGIPIVYHAGDSYRVVDNMHPDDLDHCAFRKVFSNGELLIEDTFEQIRERVRK
jgi:nicotinamide phosphoribosyltransferase